MRACNIARTGDTPRDGDQTLLCRNRRHLLRFLPMRRQLFALLLSCALFNGCYSAHRFPANSVPVRLVSAGGFTLVLPATSGSPGSVCTVLRADLTFAEVRQDTLHFLRATALSEAPGSSACAAEARAGFVSLADHPELRAERLAVNGPLTWTTLVFVALPAAIGAIVIISCYAFGCYIT